MPRNALFAAAGAVALVACPALADQPPVHEIGEVVVTAAPYAVSLDSATTSVAVVNREALDTAPVGGLGDPQWGKLHLLDGLTPSMRMLTIAKDPGCKTCSR